MKNPHEIETELKAEREHVARILDRAALAGRNLLASEQRDFDSRMAKVKGLTDELELRWAESKRANMTARDEATQREAELREQSSRTNAPPAFMGDTRTMGSDSPMGEWLVRALVGGSGSGAPFAPNELSTTVFNYLRAKSVLMQAGATVINTERHAISFPAISAGATAAWYGEGDTITASDMTAATVTATPRKVAILQTVSNELALDSLPSIWESVAANAVSQVALKMDLGFFEGSGTSNQVTGLKNISGINTGTASGANGSTVTLDFVASGIAALQQSNSNPTAIFMNPKLWGTLSTQKDSSGRYLSQATSSSIAAKTQNQLFGVPVYLSSQLSQTETKGTSSITGSIYVVDAPELKVVLRNEPAIEIDRSVLFASDQSQIRVTFRSDLVVPNPLAICRLSGLLV